VIRSHQEPHKTERSGWLRASVLGANDGVISIAGLVVGVASAGTTAGDVLLAGIAGTIAGAISMAAGEYVSVKSQADAEAADIALEKAELAKHPKRELEELTQIYMQRGLDRPLARQVAEKLTEHDALEAHARDEIGITRTLRARPIQAALASAAAFTAGSAVPLGAIALAPEESLVTVTSVAALVALSFFGATAAQLGGASIWKGALRVTFWGAAAMALTGVIGQWFDVAV
jgi:VIT1/CCC1 family predicted Fe2+/Mn2+ transporter